MVHYDSGHYFKYEKTQNFLKAERVILTLNNFDSLKSIGIFEATNQILQSIMQKKMQANEKLRL